MIYNWLVQLIGYQSTQTGQNSTLIQISGILVIMLFVVTVDLIYSLIYHLIHKNRR